MIDIDDVAAKQRLHEIVAANKSALDARVRQAAELAAQAAAAADAEEAELKAARQRKAEAEAARAAAERTEQAADRPRPKPATLSLGAEEFKRDREARQAKPADQTTPPQPVPEEPAPAKQEPPRPGRTLKLGARDDQAVEQDKPVRKWPPRPEGDDDMSGRTWLR